MCTVEGNVSRLRFVCSTASNSIKFKRQGNRRKWTSERQIMEDTISFSIIIRVKQRQCLSILSLHLSKMNRGNDRSCLEEFQILNFHFQIWKIIVNLSVGTEKTTDINWCPCSLFFFIVKYYTVYWHFTFISRNVNFLTFNFLTSFFSKNKKQPNSENGHAEIQDWK